MIVLYDDLQMCKQEISASAVLGTDEYIDAEDGLVHCSVCRERRMSVVKRNFFQGYFFPRCPCSCQIKEEQKKKEQQAKKERMERIKRRRAHGLRDKALHQYTFDHDNGSNPVIEKARACGSR